VERVEFRGALGVSAGDLQRTITDRYGRAPAAGRAAEAAELLRRTYRSRGYPNATVTPRIEETHNPDRATLIFDIDAGRRARIAAVQIIQLDADEGGPVIGVPDIRDGDPYDQEAVEQKLRDWENRLKARGYYEARASHGADIADDAYLRVNIARGPRVVVAFAGDALSASERDRLVPVRSEGSADEDLLEDAKLAVEDYLHGRGYRDAVANYTREETPGELTITFTVTQGPRYLIDAVEVQGNRAVSTDEVRRILGTDAGEPFVRSALAARVADIQNLYRSRGYTRARVDAVDSVLPPAAAAAGDRRVAIAVSIDEGPRTMVRSVTFEGNMVMGEAALRALGAPMPGAVYSQADVVNGRDRIELEYRNRGYETVNVTYVVIPGEDETQADIRYSIAEGAQSRIHHIIIVGNERTSTETIVDELLFREGEPLGYSAMINSRARLAALGLFRRVEIQPLQISGEAQRDVLVQVEEADPTTYGFGGGGELSFRTRLSDQGVAEERVEVAPRGFFEIGRRNLWGKNRSVNLFTRVSLRSTDRVVQPNALPQSVRAESNPGFNEFRVVGTFREPRLLRSGAELLVTGIVEQAVRTTFNFSRRIARAESGLRLAPGLSLTGRYSFERTKLFDEILTPDQNPILIDRLFPQVRISKFAGSLIRDTRDDLVDASRGTFIIVDGDLAGRAIGSEVGFVQTYIQAFTYHRLPTRRRVVLAFGGRVGAARGFPREVPQLDANGNPVFGPDGSAAVDVVRDLPASERFFAGGDTTVRGFSLDRLGSEETISPTGFPLGGNGVVVLNSEVRIDLAGALQGVGFFDGGNVFRRAGDLSFTDLRPAAGFGVRYHRFGTIRLDLGFNLDRRELVPGTLERGTVFHVSLGQAF
jgi:outer membrane protein insertion porin family